MNAKARRKAALKIAEFLLPKAGKATAASIFSGIPAASANTWLSPGIMRTKNHAKVLERMGVTENTTLNVRREEGGKIRVTSSLWDVAKVLGKN